MRDARDDGREAFRILREHDAGSGKPRTITLYNQLTTLQKRDSETMTDYILRAETAANALKVVVCVQILPRDFRQTLGKYYLPLTIAKFKVLKNFTYKKFRQFLKALTVKLSIFKNKTTSHPEIVTKVYR